MNKQRTLQDIAYDRLQETIGVNWRRLRVEHGLSKRKLCMEYGLSNTVQHSIEYGRTDKLRTTSLSHVETFAKALGMTYEDVVKELLTPVSDQDLDEIKKISSKDAMLYDLFEFYPYNLIEAVVGFPFKLTYESENMSHLIFNIDVLSFEKDLKIILKPREVAILEYRFRDGKTLEEICKDYGLSRNRIRQIEAKGLRRLRAYVKKYKMVPVSLVNEEKRKNQDLKRENSKLRRLLSNTPNADSIDNLLKDEHSILEIPIDELNLSVRSYNCLRRSSYVVKRNMESLCDICNMTTEDLKKVRNLGKKSYQEIIDTVHSYGLKMADEA